MTPERLIEIIGREKAEALARACASKRRITVPAVESFDVEKQAKELLRHHTYEEVAELLGIARSTVQKYASRPDD